MGTPQDHWKRAEQCVTMAQAADDHSDKALWLILAQSWVRLAQHVVQAEHPQDGADVGDVDSALAAHASD